VAVVESEDEVGALARAFNSMTRQLRELIGSLEQQVAERTGQLEQRSSYLEATAEVGRAAASMLDRQQLVQQVVELIRERFNLYYVGLFLTGSDGEWAVLEAGTGEAGKMMLARGHRIQVGQGMVGWSVAHGNWRVAEEAAADAVRLATPELPETRSEAALPLRSRGRTLGALTVQHTQPGAFDPDTMAVLQTMADQVAVALDNAVLFAESEDALDVLRRAYGEVSRQSWQDLVQARRDWGYRWRGSARGNGQRAQGELVPIEAGGKAQADAEGAPGDDDRSLTIPLKVRDQVIGALGFRKRTGEGNWTPEEIGLLETMTGQLEVALESARLYQDTQRTAARDRLLAQIVGRVRETLDVEAVLRTLAYEVRDALDLPEVVVRLRGAGTRPQSDSRVEADD
jgi:GAF domain-containing protein